MTNAVLFNEAFLPSNTMSINLLANTLMRGTTYLLFPIDFFEQRYAYDGYWGQEI